MFQVTWRQTRDGQVHRESHEFEDEKEALDFAQGLGPDSDALVHNMENGKQLWKWDDPSESVGEKGEDIAGAADKDHDARDADKASVDAAKAQPPGSQDGAAARHVGVHDDSAKSNTHDGDKNNAKEGDLSGVNRAGPVRNTSQPSDSPANPHHSNALHTNPGHNANTGHAGARGGPAQDGAQASPGNPHQDGSNQGTGQPGKTGQQADAAKPQTAGAAGASPGTSQSGGGKK